MYFDLNYIIEQVGKEKGIPKETLIEALEEAILIASKKKFGNKKRKKRKVKSVFTYRFFLGVCSFCSYFYQHI